MKRKPIVWTEAHRREATARQCEIAAEMYRTGKDTDANYLGDCPSVDADEERGWRAALGEVGLDAARIEAEVRRVDGLATGRLVRETFFLAGRGGEVYQRREDAASRVRSSGLPVVRRSRIRRRS